MPEAPGPEAIGLEAPAASQRAARRVEFACYALLLCAAALGLLGGLTGQRVLDSPLLTRVPMAISTAVLFLTLGGLLLCLCLGAGPVLRRTGALLAFLAAAGACLNGVSVFWGAGTGLLDLPFQQLSQWLGVPHVNMSPATASLFTLSGLAACPFLLRGATGSSPREPWLAAAGVLAAVVAMAGAVFLLGYAFGSPLLYGAGVVPMARSTALSFVLLGVALVCEAGPLRPPLRMFTGPSPKAQLMRAFVPLAALLSLAHALFLAHGQGGEADALLAAFVSMSTAMAVGVAVSMVARRVGGSLERAEARRAEAEARVRLALEEKTVMLKELHHRVKNNMQIISSLCLLQAEYVADPRDRELFEESQARIRSMALVHEDLYKSDDLAFVDMGSYVPRLVGQLVVGFLPAVRVECRVVDVRLPITQSVPCGMLLNELVLNCLKHAFPGVTSPELRVALRREGDHAMLEVSDNGPGLPPGFSLTSTSSFGMVLVSSLTEQLHGGIEAGAAKGGGARFALRFPLAAD
jgi:two-component sensor histidine kinase